MGQDSVVCLILVLARTRHGSEADGANEFASAQIDLVSITQERRDRHGPVVSGWSG